MYHFELLHTRWTCLRRCHVSIFRMCVYLVSFSVSVVCLLVSVVGMSSGDIVAHYFCSFPAGHPSGIALCVFCHHVLCATFACSVSMLAPSIYAPVLALLTVSAIQDLCCMLKRCVYRHRFPLLVVVYLTGLRSDDVIRNLLCIGAFSRIHCRNGVLTFSFQNISPCDIIDLCAWVDSCFPAQTIFIVVTGIVTAITSRWLSLLTIRDSVFCYT